MNNLKPKYFFTTNKKSDLKPIDFYNKVYELLKEKYKDIVCSDLDDKDSDERLERYFHLTDMLEEWVYQQQLHLNLNEPKNQMNYLFAQFVYHSGNGSFCGLIDFYKNYSVYQNNLNQFDTNSFLNNCNNNPVLVKNNIKNLLSGKYRNNVHKIEGYFNLFKNIALYLNGKNKKDIINDLKSHAISGDYTSVPNYLIKIIGRGNGVNLALACDYLKELDDEFNYLFKPDKHVKDFLDVYYGLDGKLKAEDTLKLGYNLVNDINSTGGKKITCYKLDRMIYLLGSGNFFLDHIRENKRKASIYKWKVVLPKINSNQ